MMHAANPNAANSVNRGEIVPLTVTPGSLYAENQAEAAYHLANGHQEKNGPQKKQKWSKVNFIKLMEEEMK